MKKKFLIGFSFIALLVLVCFINTPKSSAALSSTLPQITGYVFGLFSGGSTTNYLTNATSYVIQSTGVDVMKGRGMQIAIDVANTNAANGPNVVAFYFSTTLDKTNWYTNSTPFTYSVSLAAGVSNHYTTNFSSTLLDNVKQIRLEYITTSVVSNICIPRVSYGYWK